MNYLLIVFGKSNKQDEFVKTLCSDVSIMSDMGDVKYFYGPESVIVTFECSESLESITNFMNLLYGKMDLVYILLPYEKDKLSLKMDSETSKHLFDKELPIDDTEKKSDIEALVKKWIHDDINSEELLSSIENLEEEEDEIEKIISKKSEKKDPTLNELLDKISDKGILSLTEKELTLLNKYSNI